MDARQRMRWTAGLATALVIAGVERVGAQQSGATSAGAVGPTSAAPAAGGGVAGSGFADIRAPQSLGFNPNAISPFSPSIQRSFSGGFSTFSGPFGPAFNPVGSLVNGVPTFANIRAPQSG